MLNIAVCDDENVIVNQIENILTRICDSRGLPIEIDAFYGGTALEKAVKSGTRYDLIFLDIEMKNGDGITTARNIREVDENALFIYVSGYEKYAMELFQLDVFAFIKKPFSEEKLAKIFTDAYSKICKNLFYFHYRYRAEEHKVLCRDILYFESSGRKVNIYTRDGKVRFFNGKLSEVEEQLALGKVPFMRIHQSYLVNYYLIEAKTKTEVTMINGKTLSVSEERQKNFNEEYSRMLGGEIGA